MLDKGKRTTLKSLSLAVFTGLFGTSQAAVDSNGTISSWKRRVSSTEDSLSYFKVFTQVSSVNNDIEVVIMNVGNKAATITQLTPSETVTKRGRFDFSALMSKGALTLAAGESVTVSMTPHPVVLDASSSAGQRAQSLGQALRSSLSIVTDNDSFAVVDVEAAVRFA